MNLERLPVNPTGSTEYTLITWGLPQVGVQRHKTHSIYVAQLLCATLDAICFARNPATGELLPKVQP